ncbi:MAG: protein kinase [Clostridiales Family XIII bacterium]|jgi:serine/threonine protein kinase|nr:protein kinase [Clostridiales Family XIII bacterium]
MPKEQTLSPFWGAWEIEGIIGEGSCGKIYKARREEGGEAKYSAIRRVSIPIYSANRKNISANAKAEEIAEAKKACAEALQGFITEIKSFESIREHPNVVLIEEYRSFERVGNIGYDLMICTELLYSLNSVLQTRFISQEEVVKMGVDICAPLELLHSKGIIHGNIKNTKIFADGEGNYKLGLLWRRRYPEPEGGSSYEDVPQFAAPEFLTRGQENPTADVYSLGMVLYRIMNKNRAPFVNSERDVVTHEEMAVSSRKRLKGEALPPPVLADDGLAAILCKACAFNSEDRYADAGEFKEALSLYAERSELSKIGEGIRINVQIADAEWQEKKSEYENEKIETHNRGQHRKRRFIAAVAVFLCLAVAGTISAYNWFSDSGDGGSQEVLPGLSKETAETNADGVQSGSGVSGSDRGSIGGESSGVRRGTDEDADASGVRRGTDENGDASGIRRGTDEDAESGETSEEETEPAFVDSLELDSNEINLFVGESVQLTAEVDYEGDGWKPAIVWTSNNRAVALAGSSGLITAEAPGSADVMVICGDKNAMCIVTVEENKGGLLKHEAR